MLCYKVAGSSTACCPNTMYCVNSRKQGFHGVYHHNVGKLCIPSKLKIMEPC